MYQYCKYINKGGRMRRLIISIHILLILAIAFTSYASSRKSNRQLRGLMLQDNTWLGRNKAYYSIHNIKNKRDAQRKYRIYR
jgi:hypothetical protein